LLNRFEDGAVRLLALRDDDGRTRASAEMRLATLENGALALVVDKLYADGPSRAAGKPLLAAFARERAAALGVELVLTDDYVDDDVLEPLLVQLPDAVAPDYIDLAGKGHTSTGPVRALLIAAHREGPGDIEGQARALGIDVKVARHAP
jgi:hypothetical protein